MSVKLGDRVKWGRNDTGHVVATSGRDRTCLVRLNNGELTTWLSMGDMTVLPPLQDDEAGDES